MKDNIKLDRLNIESEEEWNYWIHEIPFISLPDGYDFKAIPPFGGAMTRFLIKKPNGSIISVYLDIYARLGAVFEPYWEVYPYNEDVGRCMLNETDELVNMIINSDNT